MEDIHPAATAEALDILAVREPLVPASVPALVMTPVIAMTTRRTPLLPRNQAQTGGTVVVGLLPIHLGDGTPHHPHHLHRQDRNHKV